VPAPNNHRPTWLTHRVSTAEELLQAFRIGPQDLAANRANRLGEGQIERLRRNLWTNVIVVLPLQVALVAIVVFGRPSAFGYIVVGGVFAVLTLAEVSWALRVRRAIRAGTVRCLRGRVAVRRSMQSGTWLAVGGERNRLWAKSRYVAHDAAYRVYVAPAVRLVVAMESEAYD
jgi:hypothetical protein